MIYIQFSKTQKNNTFLLKTILNVDSDVIDYIVERHSPPLDPNYRSGSNHALTTGKTKSTNQFWLDFKFSNYHEYLKSNFSSALLRIHYVHAKHFFNIFHKVYVLFLNVRIPYVSSWLQFSRKYRCRTRTGRQYRTHLFSLPKSWQEWYSNLR